MKLLLLGGTRFLGRAIVEAALAAGHEVSLFHRGRTNPNLFPDLEHLLGDRDGDLSALHGRSWDAVIDTSGYIPRHVHNAASLLANHVDHYTFISTISVYSNPSHKPMDESAPLGTLDDETVEEVNGDTYGPLKVLCERAVDEAMNGRGLSVRAGLLVGPHDHTDRFTYWPMRVGRGGEVLAPVGSALPTQFIDVRDIAEWTVQATEMHLTGPYNVTRPAGSVSMGRLLETCRQIAQSHAVITWVDESFLLKQNVAPFTELPLWVPLESRGIMQIKTGKAMQAGLTCRSLVNTIQDTLAWAHSRPTNYEWANGLTAEREAALLAAWRKAQ